MTLLAVCAPTPIYEHSYTRGEIAIFSLFARIYAFLVYRNLQQAKFRHTESTSERFFSMRKNVLFDRQKEEEE
jgi:hypothetical protein